MYQENEEPEVKPNGKKEERWFMRHNAQRSDMVRGAQNAADITGVDQYLYAVEDLIPPNVTKGAPLVVDGVTFFRFAKFTRDERRARAGT